MPWDKGRRFRLGVVSVFVLGVWMLLPKSEAEKHDFEVGKVWQEPDLVAPVDFPVVKLDSELKREREERLSRVPPVFMYEEPEKGGRRRFEAWLTRLGEEYMIWKNLNAQERLLPRERYEKARARMEQALGKMEPLQEASAYYAAFEVEGNFGAVKAQALAFYDSLYRYGYINRSLKELPREFVSLRLTASREMVREKRLLCDEETARVRISQFLERYPRPLALLLQSALLYYCRPNFYFHEELTREEEAAAVATVSPYFGKVNRGDLIIGYGEKVTAEKARKIESLYYEIARAEHGGAAGAYFSWRSLGQALALLLLMSILLRFLRANRPRIYEDGRRFLMLFTIYFTVTFLTLLMHRLGADYSAEYKVQAVYAAPFGMACIMLAIFFDDRVGFISNILLSLIVAIALANSFEYVFLQTCAGSFIVFRLNRVRKRSHFFSGVLYLMLIYVVAYLAYTFYLKGGFSRVNVGNVALLALGSFLTLLSFLFVWALERLFNITSDLTYVELLNTDHPLLRLLADRAPGTYQHSLQVANIAEALAEKVDANGLKVRVGALFHDVGKINNPDYFAENLDRLQSPHRNTTPVESARIIIAHVTDGLALADEYRLPKEIKDFIATHHGNSRVEYFYRKHVELYPETAAEAEIKFRYPGQPPRTKEEAILMIADSIEAASRTLDNPTPENLEHLVESIVAQKIQDHQLAHSPLTFRNINVIKKELNRLLVSIYHGRVKYPAPV
jgi:putative nucleotidyltransferase with HDIG domain